MFNSAHNLKLTYVKVIYQSKQIKQGKQYTEINIKNNKLNNTNGIELILFV